MKVVWVLCMLLLFASITPAGAQREGLGNYFLLPGGAMHESVRQHCSWNATSFCAAKRAEAARKGQKIPNTPPERPGYFHPIRP
jgi:hypothetical protein